MKPEAKPICSICGKEGKYKGIGIACNTPGCGQPKEQLTPEELAACREAYCKEYGYDPEWDVVIDEDFQKAFSAGLFHKQAESAKEIAELQEQLSNRVSQTAAVALDMRREQAKNREAVREIAELKAQLGGLRNIRGGRDDV